MPFEVTPREAGEFQCDLGVFLDVGYLATQQVSVRGTAHNEKK